MVLTAVILSSTVACSANDSSGSGPSVTDAPTTLSVPLRQPITDDLIRLLPGPGRLETASYGVAGEFKVASEDEVAADDRMLWWAKGLSIGYRRDFEFLSVNEDDPMKVHTAKASILGLVFRSEADASTSVARYESKMGKAVTEKSKICGGDRRVLSYDVASEKLGRFSEVMTRMGSFVGWMVYRDSITMNWGSRAALIIDPFVASVVDEYPKLSAPSPKVPVKVTSSILRGLFADREYVKFATEGTGATFIAIDDRQLETDDESLAWTDGLLTSARIVLDSEVSGRQSSPRPRMVALALSFDSAASATTSMARYEETMKELIHDSHDEFQGRWGARTRMTTIHAKPSGEESQHVFEAMHRGGSIITWVTITAESESDLTSAYWNSAVYNIAQQFAGNIFDFDPPLAC